MTLPVMDQNPLYDHFDFNEDVNDNHNVERGQETPGLLLCSPDPAPSPVCAALRN